MSKALTEAQKHAVVSKQIYEILQATQKIHGDKESHIDFRQSGVDIFIAVNGEERCRLECKALEKKDIDFPCTTYFN